MIVGRQIGLTEQAYLGPIVRCKSKILFQNYVAIGSPEFGNGEALVLAIEYITLYFGYCV